MSTEVQKYTFLWEIENFIFSTKRDLQLVTSPCFKLRMLDNTNWFLKYNTERLRASGMNRITLLRDSKDSGPDKIEINARIFFLASDGTTVFEKENERLSFAKGREITFLFLLKKDSLNKISAASSTGILTICCQIWKSPTDLVEGALSSEETTKISECSDESFKMACEEISEESSIGKLVHLHPTKYFARTTKEIEKRSFVHQIIDFSILPRPWITSFIPEYASDKNPPLLLTLSFNKEFLDADIEIRPLKKIYKHILVKCTVKVVTTKGSPACVMDGLHLFYPSEPLVWKTSFKKSNFLEDKSQYLKNDTLTLQFQLTLSNSTETCSVDELCYTVPLDSARKKKTLVDDLLKFYEKQKYCDIKLQIGRETVQAHRAVLSSRSSVFRQMFESEIPGNKIVITDVDMITLKSMLLFMYTENTESLNQENVSKLYSVAYKYQYEVLRKECSLYLASNLELGNVCEVLTLANNFGDDELKTVSFDYIRLHANEVFGLQTWKSFIQNDILLASEVLAYVSSVAKKSSIDRILM